jgi:hypothetical protein
MQDRLNTVESELKTDLKAATSITTVITGLIERGFRDDFVDYKDWEMPAIIFEALETNPADDDDYFQNVNVYLEIYARHGDRATARQNVKTYISLVQDFLMSSSWRYATLTKVGRSGFISGGNKETGFRVIGSIEIVVEVLLHTTTVK